MVVRGERRMADKTHKVIQKTRNPSKNINKRNIILKEVDTRRKIRYVQRNQKNYILKEFTEYYIVRFAMIAASWLAMIAVAMITV